MPAQNPNYQASLTFIDGSNEKSTFSIYTDGQLDITSSASWQTLVNAVDAITSGTLGTQRSLQTQRLNSYALPNAANAQREDKLQVFLTDASGNPVTLSVPTFQISTASRTDSFSDNIAFGVNGTSAINAFVAALQSTAVSPFDGTPLTVVKLVAVGRNI